MPRKSLELKAKYSSKPVKWKHPPPLSVEFRRTGVSLARKYSWQHALRAKGSNWIKFSVQPINSRTAASTDLQFNCTISGSHHVATSKIKLKLTPAIDTAQEGARVLWQDVHP